MKAVLVASTVWLAACGSKSDDELGAYNAQMKQAMAKAAPAYHLMATLQAKATVKTDACHGPPAPGLLRISQHKLKVFAGEPSEHGWLVDKSTPVPSPWDDISLPPINAFPTTSMPYIADGPQRLAEQVTALDAATGFLVQVIDDYAPGGVVAHDGKGDVFRPGTIRGRIVVFDKTGTPTCNYAYEAANADIVGRSTNTKRYAADDLYDDLERQMTDAITAALR